MEGAVGGLVDAVDRAAQRERLAPADRDRDGLAAGDRRPGFGPRETEGDLEEPGRHFPAVLLLEREEGAAGHEDVGAALAEGELAGGGNLLAPDGDLLVGDRHDQLAVARGVGLLPGRREALEEKAEHLVQQ